MVANDVCQSGVVQSGHENQLLFQTEASGSAEQPALLDRVLILPEGQYLLPIPGLAAPRSHRTA